MTHLLDKRPMPSLVLLKVMVRVLGVLLLLLWLAKLARPQRGAGGGDVGVGAQGEVWAPLLRYAVQGLGSRCQAGS